MNSKKYMIISVITLVIAIIGCSVTYAWYMWSSSEDEETKIVTSLGSAKIFYDSGSNIEGVELQPTNTKEEGIVKTITVKSSKNAAYKLSFNLYLDILELGDGLKDTSFKYALYQDDGTDPIKSGSFTEEYLSTLDLCETNNTPHIVLVDDETITTTKITYTLYIWIDGTVDNPSSMESQEFSFKLHADGQNAVLGETLVEHISNLYTPNDTAVNNGITYNLDTTNSLMNDRLGGTTESLDGGNIRYYGQNPNNYIDIGDTYTVATTVSNFEKNSIMMGVLGIENEESCKTFFDCSVNYEAIGSLYEMTYANEAECLAGLQNDYHVSSVNELCGTEEKKVGDSKLYRIIGLFKDVELADGTKKDLVKVVREDSIGDFAWDLTGTTEETAVSDNNWHDATLMTILKDHYYNASNEVTHSYFYLLTESILTPTVDLSIKGLNSNVKGKIETVIWNLGGWESDAFSDEMYGYERGDAKCTACTPPATYETTWEGKIALMYPSDAGYGTNFKNCDSTLWNYYENSACRQQNWVTSIGNGNVAEWLLTPDSDNSYSAWDVSAGDIGYDAADDGVGVRPVFYLTSDVGIVSGLGTETDPYVVR